MSRGLQPGYHTVSAESVTAAKNGQLVTMFRDLAAMTEAGVRMHAELQEYYARVAQANDGCIFDFANNVLYFDEPEYTPGQFKATIPFTMVRAR